MPLRFSLTALFFVVMLIVATQHFAGLNRHDELNLSIVLLLFRLCSAVILNLFQHLAVNDCYQILKQVQDDNF